MRLLFLLPDDVVANCLRFLAPFELLSSATVSKAFLGTIFNRESRCMSTLSAKLQSRYVCSTTHSNFPRAPFVIHAHPSEPHISVVCVDIPRLAMTRNKFNEYQQTEQYAHVVRVGMCPIAGCWYD